MYSFSWKFIKSNKFGIPKHISYLIIVIGSIVFALPRYKEPWFSFVVIAYPISMIVILEALRQIEPLIGRIETLGYKLLGKENSKEILNNRWERNEIRILLYLLVAIFFAIVSLYFNAHPTWRRYTDAMAIFYLGLVVSEIAYLLILILSWLWKLKKFRLQLNPIDPANTVKLRYLAQTVFNVAVIIGISLLLLNIVILVASHLFQHLRYGVIFISVVAWTSVIILTGFPHVIFAQIVEEKKRVTLSNLEKKLIGKYDDIVNKIDTNKVSFSPIEDIMNIHKLVIESSSYPISSNSYIGVVLTLFLNTLPVIVELINTTTN